ncbi:hypothetical protein MKW98_014756 [Papaver atlanticum]|uniref:Pentatricopeptide repeat-containing protein n=1 Tax=Papaver atlanticum TaxID=357466 RepID=A0AAD4XDP0_9MAGN|nr:hypothetical protein MKW98_014756 [Papaver atlanticum]
MFLAVTLNPIFQITSHNYSSSENPQNKISKIKTLICSPAQVQKLIASESDPLLAKNIFDLASRQPNFCHSYSSFRTLICKLGGSRHFSLIQNLIKRLKSDRYPVTPDLFGDIIQIYGDAKLPGQALKTFYTMLEFDCKPLPEHFNQLLQVLVAHQNYLRTALDLFRTVDRFGISLNTKSYSILIRAFCFDGDISIAYNLFNEMFKRDVLPDAESYRIVMQGLCRKGQVNKAVDLLEDMLNKGFVPDALSYTSLLNSLCRKKKLREAYKLLCRMKVKGCNPDIVHYNTIILGFCREKKAVDACKIVDDMESSGCGPNLVSYRTLVNGLCNHGMYDEATNFMYEMISKGFSPHVSVFNSLIKGFCNVGKIEEACRVLQEMPKHREAPHREIWVAIVPRVCNNDEMMRTENTLRRILKEVVSHGTHVIDVRHGQEEYLIRRIQAKAWKI